MEELSERAGVTSRAVPDCTDSSLIIMLRSHARSTVAVKVRRRTPEKLPMTWNWPSAAGVGITCVGETVAAPVTQGARLLWPSRLCVISLLADAFYAFSKVVVRGVVVYGRVSVGIPART
jgi:hypothetical protein